MRGRGGGLGGGGRGFREKLGGGEGRGEERDTRSEFRSGRIFSTMFATTRDDVDVDDVYLPMFDIPYPISHMPPP